MINVPLEVKVVLLGGSGVGKSSLLNRFQHDQFSLSPSTTLGAAFAHKLITVDGQTIKFQIWDTAGQEKYKALLPLYYRDSQVAIIVYDVAAESTIEDMQYWLKQLELNGPPGLITVVVGNKTDQLPQVDRDYVQSMVGLMIPIHETSCRTGEGVKELFMDIGKMVLKAPKESLMRSVINSERVSVNKQLGKGKTKQKGCC